MIAEPEGLKERPAHVDLEDDGNLVARICKGMGQITQPGCA